MQDSSEADAEQSEETFNLEDIFQDPDFVCTTEYRGIYESLFSDSDSPDPRPSEMTKEQIEFARVQLIEIKEGVEAKIEAIEAFQEDRGWSSD